MRKQKGYTLIDILSLMLIVTGIVGWVLNVIAIAGAIFSPLTGLLVLRIIGIFIPVLGAVLGYIPA